MKKIFLIPLLWGGILHSQNADSIQFKRISDEILLHGKAYDDLHELTKSIGHRLSGSEAYEKSVHWAEAKLKAAGADKVYLQPVMVPVWERGEESLQIQIGNEPYKEIKMLSIGNSEGTDGKDVVAEIIAVQSLDEFKALDKNKVKDKIVFFNFTWRHDHIQPFQAYGEAGIYRRSTASEAARKGAKAVIIRSLSSAFDAVPHTGSLRYDSDAKKIPGVAIGNTTADELAATLKTQKVVAKLNSNCTMKEDKSSFTVIGELVGNKDKSVIVVAGHLDSWDVGEGAHDDGSGVVQSIEALRTFKKLGIKPNHTIRVVLYANEENGVRGGYKYLEEVKKSKEPHLFAIESDSGGFSPRGIALDMKAEQKALIKSWAPLFLPYGVYDFEKEHSGVDIGPLKEVGVALAGLSPDPQRYFDLHHTEKDVFENVNRRELLIGATVMTQLLYMVDQNW
ncbi:M20/M25/M40 family metallo-hydrolase [Chryseobacterium sp. A301]